MHGCARGNESDGLPATSEEQRLYDSLERQGPPLIRRGVVEVPLKILHGDPAERLAEYATSSQTAISCGGRVSAPRGAQERPAGSVVRAPEEEQCARPGAEVGRSKQVGRQGRLGRSRKGARCEGY